RLMSGLAPSSLNRELMPAFDEWHRLSQPFLDPAKTRDGYLAKFFAGLEKVRVPTGDGDTIKKALEGVWKLAPSELPMIPGCENAPESWRRIGWKRTQDSDFRIAELLLQQLYARA